MRCANHNTVCRPLSVESHNYHQFVDRVFVRHSAASTHTILLKVDIKYVTGSGPTLWHTKIMILR